MEMPKGWKKMHEKVCGKEIGLPWKIVTAPEPAYIIEALDLMKEMAEALDEVNREKCTRTHEEAYLMIKKFMEWK